MADRISSVSGSSSLNETSTSPSRGSGATCSVCELCAARAAMVRRYGKARLSITETPHDTRSGSIPPIDDLVGNLDKWRKPRRADDVHQPASFVEFLAVAVDEHGIRIQRSQAPELVVDEPKPADHVVNRFERAVALANVLLDGVGARCENDDAVGTPLFSDDQHFPEFRMDLRRIFRDVRLEGDACAFEENHP